MSRKKFSKDLPHYLPLLGIFTAAALAFWFFSYDKQFQIGVAISVAIAHVTWGIVHHYIHHDLSLIVVFEYIAVSTMGLVVLLSLILRG